ncbi:(Z)-2-((N-methylformamido)methylene)-5-hydroxybutyrolactone dehydrogenase [Hyphomicrobiales bacterium]|nr:(Z)-2-((N-methylformamido)methylene)-5-hydroxybutyrolactone dehydrogenase [Hyphomicrobiales bacterium]CAH1698667.1 (Z)-2-((N-methylformamido)methylene)-5-hydroxybutyrolactone dehydrogenase [Hyphomicrobiales bacterium]CAI0342312.1 (Z)-2-((N-methylformamido)methylene)-5-hydroxybutyrolactone dehydrogenase [Hyphomicrobiales bacterium]
MTAATLSLDPISPAIRPTKQDSDQRYRYQHYIDGAFVDPAGGNWLETSDPVTGEDWAWVPRGNGADVESAVQAAHRAFSEGAWPALSASARGALMRKLGDLITENAEWLARVEMRDNGKLLAELSMQMRYMANYYYYYGGLADKIEGTVIPTDKPGVFNYTKPEPIGVVACIMPWNSPLPLTSLKLAPALAAGCTVVLKPSEFTSASLLEFAKLVEAAGFPKGVVNVITGYGAEVGDALISHPLVERIAFTGGPEAGRMINEKAARHMKRVTLELGGKSPNIIFDDADLDQAVKGAVAGIFAASGQTCVAGSRLLVQETIHDAFVERLKAFIADVKFGHPSDPGTQVAPISTRPQLEKIKSYVEIAKSEGARLVAGGEPAQVEGYPKGLFYKPTIFVDVKNEMRIAQEEVFGPVLSVIRFKDEDDAVRIANDTQFGLAAGIWTQSMRRALTMANRVRAGTVWVNNYRSTSTTSPFGGFKMSGVGREGGIAGIREYMETKSVWISTATDIPNPFIRR